MSNDSLAPSPQFREDVGIILLTSICSVTGTLTWLAAAGWWYRRYPSLLILSAATSLLFGTSLVFVLRSIRYERACRIASKLKTFSLLGAFVLYLFMLVVEACVFSGIKPYVGGFVLAIIGLRFRMWAVAEKAGVRDGVVITSGPYSIVRHPRYLGTILTVLGACLTIKPFFLVLVLALLPLLLHTAVAFREEDYFCKDPSTRDAYTAYMARVPRFLPAISSLSLTLWPRWDSYKRLFERHRWKASETASLSSSIAFVIVLILIPILFRT
jgi:protein-S-isoprenylcysteine O-methyltransferase Ste14